MRCSLFGKLSAKRDFIALSVPRNFLSAWEPWMQGSVAASRNNLGESWLHAYLTAPIWRFWLGSEICGATVLGALMPSLDGMGRYYPLTLFAAADQGDTIAPPDIDAHDAWFKTTEDFLLSTLDKELSFEAIANALDQLSGPSDQSLTSLPPNLSTLDSGAITSPLGNASFSELFAALRAANYRSVYAAASFWWTAGGSDYQPFGFCCRRMPDPLLFTTMLTGTLVAA
jgi:type VI secretion system protein ImpM